MSVADPTIAPTGLVLLGWGGTQQLKVTRAYVLTGDCRGSVTGFADGSLFFKDNLMADIGTDGVLQPVKAAPRLPSLPQMNEEQEDEDGHTHTDSGLGEFVTGARIAQRRSGQGVTDYFVGAWHRGVAYTVAMFARNPQGILSPAAALVRSQLPVRGLTYVAGPDATAGKLGIVLEAPGELRLLSLDWTHPDFTR